MKKAIFTSLIVSMAATVVFAQPPEEVPPPPPDSGVVETAPAPAQSAPVAAPVAQPVAEVRSVPAPAAPPEDKRIKGMGLSPSLGIIPLGYDNIGVTGSEGRRWYMGVSPSLSLDTSFKTSTDKTIDFNVGYSFGWREYYNKATTNRDFDNTFSSSIGMKLNDQMSWSLPGSFEYFFKNGTDASGDNFLQVEVTPMFSYSFSKELSFKVKYDYTFLDAIDSPVYPNGLDQNGDAPDDIDDIRRGSFLTDATGFDNFDSSQFGVVPGTTTANQVGKQSEYTSDNTVGLSTSYKPIDGTSLGFAYDFLFSRTSNNDSNNLSAHFVTPSITQQFPWKTGSITLANQFRFRKYDYTRVDVGDGSSVAKQAFRSSLRLSVSQDMNDYMSFEAGYRLDLVGNNADNYGKWTNSQSASMGVNFKF